eukprot:5246824-Prymnesium_polylepis.1
MPTSAAHPSVTQATSAHAPAPRPSGARAKLTWSSPSDPRKAASQDVGRAVRTHEHDGVPTP